MMINIYLVISIIVSILAGVLLYKPYFGAENDFWECLRSFSIPLTAWRNNDIKRKNEKSLKFTVFLSAITFISAIGGFIGVIFVIVALRIIGIDIG